MSDTRVMLAPGDSAPDFTLHDADGKDRSLAELLQAGRLVLYFYPAALTPGCTTEACDFRDNLTEFARAGLHVAGVSPDSPEKLQKFRDAKDLNFPLLSDPERTTLRAYGAYGQKRNYGRTVEGVIRSTVVINGDGTIAKAFYNVRATGHVSRVMRELGL